MITELPPELIYSIFLRLPYETLEGIGKLTPYFRMIIRDDRFWQDKARTDFPFLMKGKELKFFSGRNARLRYVDVYRMDTDRHFLDHRNIIPGYDGYFVVEDIFQIRLKYIAGQRRAQFPPNAPRVHDWTFASKLRVCDRTNLYFSEIVSLVEDHCPDKDIRPGDIIEMTPSYSMIQIVLFVDDQYKWYKIHVGCLPEEAIPIFKRWGIHSRCDLRDLYDKKDWRRINTRLGFFLIPDDEAMYQQKRDGYYHESLEIDLPPVQ